MKQLMRFNVNGMIHEEEIDHRRTLLEFAGMRSKNRVLSMPVASDLAGEDAFVTGDLMDRYIKIAEGRTKLDPR
jgi:hypothetical protein